MRPREDNGGAMRPAPFYGWVVLGAAFAIIALSIGTLFTLGVFLKPIEEGMGWSRSSIGAVGLLNWLVMGLGGVAAGYLSDRFGTRVVVLVGGALLGLGLVLSSQVSEAWQLYVTFGVLVGAGVSAFYVPLTVLAIRWFDDRRGMAAAIVSAGNGLGIMALSPLSRWLINELDWRSAFVVLGDLAWLIVIPCALFLKPSPTAAPAPGWASAASERHGPGGANSGVVAHLGHRAHPLCVLCGALRADLPPGLPRHRPGGGEHGGRLDPGRLGPVLHRRARRQRDRCRPPGRQAHAHRHARVAGSC